MAATRLIRRSSCYGAGQPVISDSYAESGGRENGGKADSCVNAEDAASAARNRNPASPVRVSSPPRTGLRPRPSQPSMPSSVRSRTRTARRRSFPVASTGRRSSRRSVVAPRATLSRAFTLRLASTPSLMVVSLMVVSLIAVSQIVVSRITGRRTTARTRGTARTRTTVTGRRKVTGRLSVTTPGAGANSSPTGPTTGRVLPPSREMRRSPGRSRSLGTQDRRGERRSPGRRCSLGTQDRPRERCSPGTRCSLGTRGRPAWTGRAIALATASRSLTTHVSQPSQTGPMSSRLQGRLAMATVSRGRRRRRRAGRSGSTTCSSRRRKPRGPAHRRRPLLVPGRSSRRPVTPGRRATSLRRWCRR